MSGLTGFDEWLTSPPEGPKWHEPKDEHEDKAMEEMPRILTGLPNALPNPLGSRSTHRSSSRAVNLSAPKS